jgi:hypothetical protein
MISKINTVSQMPMLHSTVSFSVSGGTSTTSSIGTPTLPGAVSEAAVMCCLRSLGSVVKKLSLSGSPAAVGAGGFMCTAADEDLQLPPYAAVMLVLLVPAAAAAAGPCLPAAVMLTEVLRV